MNIKAIVGASALVIVLSGCASAANPVAPTMPPSPAPTAAAPSTTPSDDGEPKPAQIQWIDGSMSYADADAARKIYNFIEDVGAGKPSKVKLNALITDAKVVEKDGDATFTLTVDEVTPSSAGGEEGPGYVNPSKATRQITVTNPLILVIPPNVVTPTPNDFVSHLKEFSEPFSFYYQGSELVAVVQWYHP